ncbi:MAG TPA: ABC transporter permease [Euzebya sp.]|nr:ABC transporter permease [Euzebya sp.]
MTGASERLPRGGARGHWALRQVLARMLPSVGVLVAVTFVVFAFIHAAPGGPEQSLAGPFASEEQRARIRQTYGLDDPLLQQYGRFVTAAVQLDFGTSVSTREPVTQPLARAAAVSVPLLLMAWLVSTLLGWVLGLVTARRAGGPVDRLVLATTVVGASAPVFAVGVGLAYLFGVQLGWLPTVGSGDGGLDSLSHLVLPAVTLVILALASVTKVARVRIGQVLVEDQMTFATARGLSSGQILFGSVLRNAGVQLVTHSGALLIAMIGALIVVEAVFSLDGIGRLLVGSISTRDIPLIQAITLFMAVFIITVNLLVDLACLVIDPRMRVQGAVSDG